ncbi:MAG: chloride channel protein [Flavobacteriales bacterium]|nr:chloride channel protein [Flavobacteriales bacterium]
MSSSRYDIITSKVRVFLSGLLERLRQSLLQSRAKELVLLALPYQISAILTALVAVGYAKLFHLMEDANLAILSYDRRLIFLTAPISFLVAWGLVRRLAPLAGGSGIPQLMAAIEVATEKKRDASWRFLNVRIILVKIASSLTMVLGGGAIGREGPTLQIAGSIYRTVHKLLPPFWPRVSRQIMMVTGGAAGLSAAFNTPLGGIVFAVEELTKTHMAQFRTAVLTAVILSGMTAQWLLGPYLMLGYPKLEPATFSFMYKILFIAVISGATGAIFCRILLAFDKFRRTLAGWLPQAAFALGCAFLFALTVWFLGPHAIGSGNALLEEYLFAAEVDGTAGNVGARILGPMFSFSAGGAGGIFAPALSAGAAIGGWIAPLFEPSRGQFNLLVLAGMTAFLTGVTRSPFTSAILVLEMTDRHSAIFQLMYAAMVGFLISFAIDRKSYYERMKERLLKALPGWPPPPEKPQRNGVRGVEPGPNAPEPGAGF